MFTLHIRAQGSEFYPRQKIKEKKGNYASEPGTVNIVLAAEPRSVDPCDNTSSIQGQVLMQNVVESLSEAPRGLPLGASLILDGQLERRVGVDPYLGAGPIPGH